MHLYTFTGDRQNFFATSFSKGYMSALDGSKKDEAWGKPHRIHLHNFLNQLTSWRPVELTGRPAFVASGHDMLRR